MKVKKEGAITRQQLKTTGVSSSNNKVRSGRRRKKNSAREYSEAILVALLAALFLRAFVVQAFRIPTGSMKNTLLVGDFLLVNKFIYGVRTPDRIPFVNAEIPFFRLPAFKAPQNGEVVVFKYPEDESLDYIKRCIAIGGQTIEIREGEVYLDGKPEGRTVDLGRQYDSEEGRYVRYTRVTSSFGKIYDIRHYDDGYARTENMPPIQIPAKGQTIRLTPKNQKYYRTAITQFEGAHEVEVRNGRVYIDGHQTEEFTFSQDYYFMMGDNRDNSADSRSWGLLPAENVVGEALIIYFSWDKDPGFLNLLDSIRWSRIASLIT